MRLIWEGRRPGPLLRGHLLLYERRGPAAWTAAVGLRILLLVAVLELVVGPRAGLLSRLGLDDPPVALRIPLLAALALIAARLLGARFDDLGLKRWRDWTETERLYLPQVVLIAAAVFAALNARSLGVVPLGAVAMMVPLQLLWGGYQELVYRGMLQNELDRRFGPLAGIALANVAFTFGPLHVYHFSSGAPPASIALGLATIFAVGLLFGWIFHRTRNLWLVGLLHGIGNVFTNGGPELAALAG